MKFTFLGAVLLVFAVVFSLAVTKMELVTPKTESSFVKFKIKDLPEHGVSLIASSEATFTKGKRVTIDPYSVLLKNTSSRAIVGYAMKWECSGDQTQTVARDMSRDRIFSNSLGVVFLYGEESDRRARLNRLEGVIKPHSTWLIANDYPAYQMSGAAHEEQNIHLDEAAIAELRAACPTMTVTADGIFFDDGTFIGPDTTSFFASVKTQMDARYEILQGVQNDLKSGKTPNEVFKGLEQIRDRDEQNVGEPINELRSYFRNLFARDVLGKKEAWGPDKAIKEVQELLSRPWVKLRKL
jgi:hypothetical protein